MNQRGCGPEEMSAVFGAKAALFCCLRAATRFAVLGFGACTRIRSRDQLIKSFLLLVFRPSRAISYGRAPSDCCDAVLMHRLSAPGSSQVQSATSCLQGS